MQLRKTKAGMQRSNVFQGEESESDNEELPCAAVVTTGAPHHAGTRDGGSPVSGTSSLAMAVAGEETETEDEEELEEELGVFSDNTQLSDDAAKGK